MVGLLLLASLLTGESGACGRACFRSGRRGQVQLHRHIIVIKGIGLYGCRLWQITMVIEFIWDIGVLCFMFYLFMFLCFISMFYLFWCFFMFYVLCFYVLYGFVNMFYRRYVALRALRFCIAIAFAFACVNCICIYYS
jgi:hypothetical protein